MFPEFEVCITTRSTITEVPFSRYSGTVIKEDKMDILLSEMLDKL